MWKAEELHSSTLISFLQICISLEQTLGVTQAYKSKGSLDRNKKSIKLRIES